MDIIKKENGWVWLFLTPCTFNFSSILLAKEIDAIDKKAWYYNYKNWLLGFLLLVIPGIIMLFILNIQMTCNASSKLEVPGKEIYTSPYFWILCLIIPFVGWSLFVIMLLYLLVFNIVKICQGKAEKFI